MLKQAAIALTLLLTLGAAPAAAQEFREGQIWRYDTRPGEENSRLFIARIDRGLGNQSIYHIYLDGLRLKNRLYEGGVQDHLPHAAVARQALAMGARRVAVMSKFELVGIMTGIDFARAVVP